METVDQKINSLLAPISKGLLDFVLYKNSIAGVEVPLIIIWLISAAAVFFTVYFRFLIVTGLWHAIRMQKGDFEEGKQ